MVMVAIAVLLGLLAERMLDVEVRIPGIGAAVGLLGLYLGDWLWDLTDWSPGPLFAGFPIVPTAVGALAVCGFLKLVVLAADSR